jgi:hypothetical protein
MGRKQPASRKLEVPKEKEAKEKTEVNSRGCKEERSLGREKKRRRLRISTPFMSIHGACVLDNGNLL